MENNKVSIITVVFNDVSHIKDTMESVFSQTWKNKEYIVIDGGSTDGTAEIIKSYSHCLAFWCSEKDDGIYDAMNKGIKYATGDWIGFLNSGDRYASSETLTSVFCGDNVREADIVYGDSIEIGKFAISKKEAESNVSLLEFSPIYRHGSSFVRSAIQKRYLFDTSGKARLGYALDWNMIYQVYKAGYRFKKEDIAIECYRKEGVSDRPFLNLWYNYLITSKGGFSLNKMAFLLKGLCACAIKRSHIYRWFRSLFLVFIINDIIPFIPFWTMRRCYFRIFHMSIGNGTFIMKDNYFINPNKLTIGKFSHINRGCVIDARGGIEIGNSVSVSYNVSIMTGSHDIESKEFMGTFQKIEIQDYVWIGAGAIILQGVNIGKGAVVCAGAVVTRDIEDFSIVAGIPAKKIGERPHDIDYKCVWNTPLT